MQNSTQNRSPADGSSQEQAINAEQSQGIAVGKSETSQGDFF